MPAAEGLIFDIQRYSIHDGPGIRTTVFFKGCPLRCRWCHNPESNRIQTELLFHKNLCTGCGRCMLFCKNGSIRIGDDCKAHTDRERCVVCGACTEPQVCSRQARETAGRNMTAEEVTEEILKDRIFYGGNGGVTFSGGESLSQPGFLNRILDLCRKEGITTAIETSGYATDQVVKTIFPKLDYLLIDIKKMDSKAHRILTGVSNEQILKNIKFAALELNIKIWIRLPLIAQVNDSEKEAEEICRFLAPFKQRIERVCLLAYHNLGLSKLESLDWPSDVMKQFKAPPEDHFQKLKRVYEREGFFVKI